MPRLSLTMTEGVIRKWLKRENDYVKKGETLVEIESDKAVFPFESPHEGYLLKILVEDGNTAECQADIAVLGEKGEAYTLAAEPPLQPETWKETRALPTVAAAQQPAPAAKIFASPAAKRTAKELGLNLSLLTKAPGKKRIEKKDITVFLEANKIKTTPLAQKIAAEHALDLSSAGKKSGARIYSGDLTIPAPAKERTGRKDAVAPVQGMRKVIAAQLRKSLDVAVHVSMSAEVDMANALSLRACITDSVRAEYGVKPSLNDIVLKCVAVSLLQHPRLNSVFDGANIIERGNINIGVAVALDDGLVVPVIKDCDQLPIGEIAARSRSLARKAREQGLSREEMSDGTFTVSNLGAFGITQFTSIINQPESAILSVGQVTPKPVVLAPDHEIAVRPRMNMTINFDHRSIDGAVAAKFMQTLVKLLEEPRLLLA
jgi:pyruvate dehydrogenase E2 component (dihydrolipoamide acetyltransferase)